MSELKIAVSRSCPDCFSTQRTIVNVDESHFIDVAAVVLSVNDIERGKLDEINLAASLLIQPPLWFTPLFAGMSHGQIRR